MAQRAHSSRREETAAKLTPLMSALTWPETHRRPLKFGEMNLPYELRGGPVSGKNGSHGENGRENRKLEWIRGWWMETLENNFCWNWFFLDAAHSWSAGRSRWLNSTGRGWKRRWEPKRSPWFKTDQLQQRAVFIFINNLSKCGKDIHINIPWIPAHNYFNHYK